MAAPYNPPVKGTDFKIGVCLRDANDNNSFKVNPTLAAGDVKISKDFGAFANLTTLPSVSPAGGVQVMLTISATEKTADVITVTFIDQTSPKEWADYSVSIPTTA